MNPSDATGPLSRYGPQSFGRGDRITSSPSLRMNTSPVLNWNSFGNRTAWLRLFMNTLARRCMVGFLPGSAPYTLVYATWSALLEATALGLTASGKNEQGCTATPGFLASSVF